MKKSLGAATLAYPLPAWVVGSYDSNGRPNVMTAAWGGICCSQPPALCVAIRPNRYTFQGLTGRQAFTVSVPSADQVEAVDYFGLVSGKDTDKFAATGLTPVQSEHVDAPFIDEFPMVLECRLMKTVEIGAHILCVGEIMDVKVDEHALGENGRPDMSLLKPVVYDSGRQAYFGIGKCLAKAFSAGKTYR
jgi:flavin reductase (DIM6/NTAB) family NADH-FMN oxidoreductase RutF